MNTLPYILGYGSYAPPHVYTNADLERIVDTTDEWISSRTGIKQRHCIQDSMPCEELGVHAATEALQQAQTRPSEVTHLIAASCSADLRCPPLSCLLAKRLDMKGQTVLDVNSACNGFISCLDISRSILSTHADARILLIANETLTRFCNWKDRSTCVLFGDGAGAVVLGNRLPTQIADSSGITANLVDTLIDSDPQGADLLFFGGSKSNPRHFTPDDPVGAEFFIHMNGREVFKHAVRNMTAVCKRILHRNNLQVEEIDIFIPHQANQRIIEAVGSRLGVQIERVFTNVQIYGNTSAASIPIALAEALKQKRIRSGSKVLLSSFGGGLTWGASLLYF